MDDRPIGMFDSGFGGLTVARAVIDLLPAEDLVYFGDTARYPYGPRPLDEVRQFALEVTRLLVELHHVKMVVVACNTATAAALELLRFEFDVPVVGVIDPGVRSLVRVTRNGRVGVIGTVGTIGSGAYQRAVRSTRAPVELSCAACPGFVEFVERGETASDQVHVLAERLLAPLVEDGVDALLLGCTHYPLPGPHDRRRHGPRGRPCRLRRRDGVRGAVDPRGDRSRPALGGQGRTPLRQLG
jgi:glutamate racemase